MLKINTVIVLIVLCSILGCDDGSKKAHKQLMEGYAEGTPLQVDKIIWGPDEYEKWNPLICFAGDCPIRSWRWCAVLKAHYKDHALKTFYAMYAVKMEVIQPGYYNYLTTPSAKDELQRQRDLEKYQKNRKLYEKDFGIYVYKLAEAKTPQERTAVENEIVEKLMHGAAIKIEYRRGREKERWFYGNSDLEYGKRTCP